MICRDFFEANKGSKELCTALQKVPLDDQLAWEGESASPHSLGPIEDDEVFCRQVVDPTHFDKVSGTIKPNFLDDASHKGASGHRLKHTTVRTLREISEARVAKANEDPPPTGLRESIGYATVTAAEVRCVFTEPLLRRALGIYDTGREDDRSHADICQLVSGKQQGKSIRAQLFKIAKDRLVRFQEVDPSRDAIQLTKEK